MTGEALFKRRRGLDGLRVSAPAHLIERSVVLPSRDAAPRRATPGRCRTVGGLLHLVEVRGPMSKGAPLHDWGY